MKVLMAEALDYENVIHVGSHHYADHFVKGGNEVFWYRTPISFINIIKSIFGADKRTNKNLLRHWIRGVKRINKQLITYHGLTLLPFRDYPLLNSKYAMRKTASLCIPTVKSTLKINGFNKPDILWLSQTPSSSSLAKLIDYKKLIYRMSDDYESFSSIPENSKYAEREIIDKADIVFVTAHKLYEKVKSYKKNNVYYLPNGSDYNHFRNCNDSHFEPKDIKKIPHPRVVYAGTIADWFDIDTLCLAAAKCPDISFILIGPSLINLDSTLKFSNIYHLGSKNYSELPRYFHSSDASIIPFIKNKLTESTNPVKLYEYFSAGLPVICRNLHEVRALESPAVLYDTPEEFVANLQKVLTMKQDSHIYHEFGRINSWETRFNFITECINTNVNSK